MDTKTRPDGERCKLVIRDCHLHGWNQPAQIGNTAALNLKEHVEAEITRCVFSDNEIALRVRGPGSRGGARVTVAECAIYHTQVAVRAEDRIESLTLRGVAYGEGVKTRLEMHHGKELPGFTNEDERPAPPLEVLLKEGFPGR